MNKLILNTFAIEVNDLLKICTLLRRKDIICTIYSSNEFDQYDLVRYTEEISDNRHTFIAIFDTNIVIDLLHLCKGDSINVDDNLSDTKITSCALLILLQCLDIKIEPGFGIHEISQNDNYVKGHNNLSLFRAIDNLNPMVLNELLKGNIKNIKNELNIQSHTIGNQINPYDWYIWFLTYTCVLKIIILEKTLEDNYSKIKEFINWMWSEFIFCAAPTVFTIIYFSKHKLSKMLKNVSTNSYSEILKLVKNVTWDLCAIEYWSIEAYENHPKGIFYLFCTQDKMLKEISKHIVVSRKNVIDIEKYSYNLFLKYWGKTEGEILYNYYNELFMKLNTYEREKRLNDNKKTFSNYYKILEDKLHEICQLP